MSDKDHAHGNGQPNYGCCICKKTLLVINPSHPDAMQ